MASGADFLPYLSSLISWQPTWRVLIVTAENDNPALSLAPHVAQVVLGSPTYTALTAAQRQGHVGLCLHAADHLPYPWAAFDAVIAFHVARYSYNAAAFATEWARVLRDGGVLALVDYVVSAEPPIARFVNTLERLRDTAHVWAYSLEDWEAFLHAAGLVITHREACLRETDFDEWAAAAGVQGDDLLRLRALLVQAPQAPRAYLAPRSVGSRLVFRRMEGILIGHKAQKGGTA